jgi:hypothetical protein
MKVIGLFVALVYGFSIVCPPDFHGTLDDGMREIFQTLPMTTGLGCNDTELTLSVNAVAEPIYLRKKDVTTRDEPGNIIVVVSVTPETNVTTQTPIVEEYDVEQHQRSLLTFPDNKAKTVAIYHINSIQNQSTDWVVTGDVDDTTDEGLFTELIGTTLYVISWPNNARYTIFHATGCQHSGSWSMVRYDNEAQRFVIATIDTTANVICVAVAVTPNLSNPFHIFEFQHALFNITDFQFSVWGDYYNACWVNGATQRWCSVMERARMINYNYVDMPRINIIEMPLGNTARSNPLRYAPYATMYQDKNTRGPLINEDAPCGVFSTLQEIGAIKTYLCNDVDFVAGTIHLVDKQINVGSFTAFHSCIPTYNVHGSCKRSFFRYNRLAYFYRNGMEKIAYSFIHYMNGMSMIAWGETTDALITNPQTHHAIYSPYTHGLGAVFLWAPSVAYNCRGDLFMIYNRVTYGTVISLDFSYRLHNDPKGVFRNPATFDAPTYEPSSLAKWGYTHAVMGTIQPRHFYGIGATSDYQAIVLSMRISNVTLTYQYTATDMCGNTQTCIRMVYLTNVDTCI